jgi:phosphomannomutase
MICTPLTCFKAYDIRGRVPEELNTDAAYRIGRAYADFLNPGDVVVGYDVRLTSRDIASALAKALMTAELMLWILGFAAQRGIFSEISSQVGAE